MRLADLLDGGETLRGRPPGETEIAGIACDSREAGPGFLFAALPGVRADGRHYVDDALARGAAALLVPPDADLPEAASACCTIVDDNPRRRLAALAAAFHAPQPETVAAVTGTNGKTSTAVFARGLWSALGLDAASIGTLGVHHREEWRGGGLTTPESIDLHRELAALAKAGARRAAVEASSHGLAQHRLDGVRLAAAGFTNLSYDHLDYHVSFAAYRAAKTRLFAELLPAGAAAALNADGAEFDRLARICRERSCPVIDYGREAAELRLLDCRPDGDGQAIEVEAFGRRRRARLAFPGEFQAANALCAAALVAGVGDDWQAAVEALETLRAPPGRLELAARGPAGAPVYVDYAHTPDALAHALGALRPRARSRLWVVFGCGGDRDPAKRPLMGETAARLADRVVVTDDNPRGEDPAEIRRAILAACPDAWEIGDRAEAIRAALGALGAGDALLVAGKGHEKGQIVGDAALPFDDAAQAAEAARALGGGAA